MLLTTSTSEMVSGFCQQTSGILRYVGFVLLVIKIAIPVLIIAYGVFDLAKAVINSKEEETSKAIKRLIWRIIAGIAIFFVPSLVLWIFSTVNSYNKANNDFDTCRGCILYPYDSKKCQVTEE